MALVTLKTGAAAREDSEKTSDGKVEHISRDMEDTPARLTAEPYTGGVREREPESEPEREEDR